MKILGELIDKPISGEWGQEGDIVKVLRTTNFTNEAKLKLNDVVSRNIDEAKISKKKLRKGDIIIEKSGGSPKQPVGRVVYFDEEGLFLCNNFTSVLRPKQDKVFPKYLLYQLFSNHRFGFTNAFQNKTTGIINLQLTRYVKSLKIPLPPLAEQKRIAKILDQADQLRQLNQQILAEYDALTKSLFLDMFGDPVRNPMGWEVKLANNYIDLLTGYAFKSKDYSDNKEHIKLCGGLIIMPWGINWAKANRWNPNNCDNLKKYWLEQGDIVMAMDRPWISSGFKISCLTEIDMPSLLVQRTARIRGVNIDQTFLYYIYNSSAFERHAKPTETTVPHISSKDIRSFKIIMPPINLQKKFAEKIKNIEAQKANAQATLAASEDLFNNLLQKAFKGEL